MPANRSPAANRAHTLSRRKSSGTMSWSSSAQSSGHDTGAPGRGRTEYTLAMLAPDRFIWWSMNTCPARRARGHCMVAVSGSARTTSRPTRSTNARTSTYGWTGSTGTNTCMPVAPDVLAKARRPSPSSTTLISLATWHTSA